MRYRVIYKKEDGRFYCQELENYISWFGFGKEKSKWVYLKRWCEGSYNPPSCDTFEPISFVSLETAKKHLSEYIEKRKKPEIEVVYENGQDAQGNNWELNNNL